MRYATVNNWRKFQHYMDRRPPWIKLHRDILDKPEFMGLPLASRSLLMLIWLLASESDTPGRVRIDLEYLSFRMRVQISDKDLNPLIGEFITEDASNVLAERLQVAIPETEGEGETEGETDPPLTPPTGGNGNGNHSTRRVKVGRKIFVPPTVAEVRAFCEEKGVDIDPVLFVAHYEARDWKPKGYSQRMSSWQATLATWVRNRRNQ